MNEYSNLISYIPYFFTFFFCAYIWAGDYLQMLLIFFYFYFPVFQFVVVYSCNFLKKSFVLYYILPIFVPTNDYKRSLHSALRITSTQQTVLSLFGCGFL